MKKGMQTVVGTLPKCDFCDIPAIVDGATVFGPWANMCEEHYIQNGLGLGAGKGQKLILAVDAIIKPCCKNYRKDDESCRTGNYDEKVLKGGPCIYHQTTRFTVLGTKPK